MDSLFSRLRHTDQAAAVCRQNPLVRAADNHIHAAKVDRNAAQRLRNIQGQDGV